MPVYVLMSLQNLIRVGTIAIMKLLSINNRLSMCRGEGKFPLSAKLKLHQILLLRNLTRVIFRLISPTEIFLG